jgi:hypothetical protein
MAARHVGDLLHIQIRDEGTGMTEAQLDAAHDRVANPRRLDQRATQQMGLPVVGAIAARLGIKVEFRSTARRGTTVDLTVPGSLFVHQRPEMQEPTRELTTVPGPVAPAPPPSWPLPAGHSSTSTPAEPVIFDQMWQSWFRPSTGPGAQPPAESARQPSAVSPEWAAAARTAAAVAVAEPTETTRSGLPVRKPGQRVIPETAPATQQSVPVQRSPERLRRQMAAMQHGLGQAGRRTVHSKSKGDPR